MIRRLFAMFNINLPPMPASPPSHTPDRGTLAQLAAVVAVALLLHFSIASLTIAAFSCIVFALKCLTIYRNSKPLPQWLLILLTITSIGLIIMSYGGWNGQTAGISFLVLLVALKFLESQTVRDYFVVCLILYFLAASSFLFNSSLPSIFLVICYTIAITGLLFKITNPAHVTAFSAIKSSSALIAKAVPLALFLFFFFPRVQGSFGFLPSLDKDTNALEDSLVAGDMASNAFSNELAFKAEFKGLIPPTSRLYWRAKVMNEEVDFAWVVSEDKNSEFQNQVSAIKMREQATPIANTIDYEVLHEPSRDAFIPYLDYVRTFSKGLLGHDYSVRVRRAERGAFAYSGTSTLIPSLDSEAPRLADLIATKSRPTARIQAVLTRIEQSASTDLEKANAVYDYFLNNEFNYSLSPPGLDEFTPLDDFLFNTKTGYCEHYASAFTTLLRWLEVPARVVVGYHGGTVNNTGNFVEVRYSDAHAWSEAYLDGSWVRYDATGAISPERIEYGMNALRELWESGDLGSNASGQALSDFLNPTGSERMWRKMIETWSNVQYQWKKWVVDYDFETQQELLTKIGLSAKNSLVSLMVVLSGGVFIILMLFFWQLIPKPVKRNQLERTYLKFIAKAKRAGVIKKPSDTPNELATKLRALHPNFTKQIQNITTLYLELNYGPSPADSTLRQQKLNQLKREISRLKLPRKARNLSSLVTKEVL